MVNGYAKPILLRRMKFLPTMTLETVRSSNFILMDKSDNPYYKKIGGYKNTSKSSFTK